jgi:hypothetical protein
VVSGPSSKGHRKLGTGPEGVERGFLPLPPSSRPLCVDLHQTEYRDHGCWRRLWDWTPSGWPPAPS